MPPEGGAFVKYRWDKKYLYWGVTAFLVIVGSITFFLLLFNWPTVNAYLGVVGDILMPVIYGMVIAYLLSPLCNLLERWCFKPLGNRCFSKSPRRAFALSRGCTVVVALIIALALIAALLWLVLPQLYLSIERIIANMSGYVQTVQEWIERQLQDNPDLEQTVWNVFNTVSTHLSNWLENSLLPEMGSVLGSLSLGVIGVVKGLFNFFMGLVISVYLLYSKEMFLAQTKKVLYSVLRPRITNVLLKNAALTHKMFGGFLTTKIIDSAIVGVICYIVLLILRMPYAALISVLVGVTNIIPFFGPFIGGIPSALLILLEDPMKCLIFIVFIVLLQQFEGNILEPRLMGNSMGLNGFWVMVVLVVGGGLFGFVGMIISVPIFAVLYTLLRSLCAGALRKRDLPEGTEAYRNLQYIDPETREPVYRREPERVAKRPRRRGGAPKESGEKPKADGQKPSRRSSDWEKKN